MLRKITVVFLLICLIFVSQTCCADTFNRSGQNSSRYGAKKEKCSSCQLPALHGMRTKDMFFVCHACAKNIITPASASKIMYKVRKDLAEMFGFDTKHRISLKIVNRNTLTKESGMATSLGCMKYRFQKIVRWKGKSRKIRYKHTCQIFLLDTLNINNAGGVLAHELTHDYLFHHMGKPVDSQVSEGICEAVAGAWLLQNGYEKQFRIKKQNPDPVYGAGFRLIYPQLERLGFKKMLEQNRSGFKRFR